jgi:NAD(P)-dependent dehydrogenase (short-subunit alcohol dehydrogenase family)
MAHARKTVLITGATAGIGKHTALYLHARGHHVIGTGRNEKALDELRSSGIDALKLDVTSAASIDAAKLEVDRITGGRAIDVLVNNAGYGQVGPIEMLSDADVRAQFDTNVFGLLAVTRAFLPGMRARGFGRVINVSSVGGRMVFPLMGIYHATKYALEAISDAMRLELRQFGIRVSLIEPGYIKTDFTATSIESVQKYVQDDSPYAASVRLAARAGSALEPFAVGPRSVARAIEHAATSRFPRARYVAPSYNALALVLMSLTPTWLTDRLFRRVARLSPPARSLRAPAQLSA